MQGLIVRLVRCAATTLTVFESVLPEREGEDVAKTGAVPRRLVRKTAHNCRM